MPCSLPILMGILAYGAVDRPLPPSPDAFTPYNVILYVLDTTRADHFGIYGYPRDTTPFMDQLAADGVRWERFSSASTWTIPSVVSILTGLNTQTHKCINYSLAPDPSWEYLPDLLKGVGYHTSFVTSNKTLWPEGLGIQTHFDRQRLTGSPDANLTDAVLQVVRSPELRPFFVYAQPRACHGPYKPPPPYDELFVGDEFYGGLGDVPSINPAGCEGGIKASMVIDDITSMDWYVAQYDGLLAYMDAEVERLFTALDEEGLRDSTLVIITADHGEELAGERNLYFCHRDHYEGNNHIPFLVILPEAFQREYGPYRGLSMEGNANLTDVLPTILGILGLPVPPSVQGRNLLELRRPERAMGSAAAGRSLRRGPHKMIMRGLKAGERDDNEIYDLAADPLEQVNLADSLPDLEASMEAELIRVSALLDSIEPPAPPVGLVYTSDFEDPAETDGFFYFSEHPNANRGWGFVERGGNRMLFGQSRPGAGGGNLKCTAQLIAVRQDRARVDLRLRLLRGQAVIATCWTDRYFQGYALSLTADRAVLERYATDQAAVRLGESPIDLTLGDWHDVTIDVGVDRIRVVIDGTEVIASPDVDPRTAWGTVVFGLEDDTRLFIDDLRVEIPPLGRRPGG